jgi:hypothetical protein
MNHRNFFFVWGGLSVGLFALLFLSGCGGPVLPSDLPKLHPTVITVLQEGKPLADAFVSMVNVDASVKWSCAARTDASGRATMQTNGMYAGAPEGTYQVVIVKQDVEGGADPYADAPDPNVDREAYQAWYSQNAQRIAAASRQQRMVYDLLDPKFGSLSTTTLELTVVPGRNQVTFDVGAAIREVSRF